MWKIILIEGGLHRQSHNIPLEFHEKTKEGQWTTFTEGTTLLQSNQSTHTRQSNGFNYQMSAPHADVSSCFLGEISVPLITILANFQV